METTTVNFDISAREVVADCRDEVNCRDVHHLTLKTGEDDSTAYASSICDSRTSKSSRSSSRFRSATRSRTGVHNRLFERSMKKNEEGKKLRRMIEKSRNPTPPPIVKISETEAENLYQRLYDCSIKKQMAEKAMKEAERQKRRLAEIAAKRQAPKLKEDEADRLFNRLSVKMTKAMEQAQRAPVEQRDKEPRRIISTGASSNLYDRLFGEKLKKDLRSYKLEESVKKERRGLVRRIDANSADKLFSRLHVEKKKGDMVVVEKEKKGSTLDKRSAIDLSDRLAKEEMGKHRQI